MNSIISSWYVVYTKPRHEKKISAGLSEIGINSLLPMVKTLTRWNDRYRYIYRPLFPSYVFVYPKDKVDYYRTSAMDGVCYFVKHGKDACKVSDIIIKDIQIITGRGTEIEVNNNYYQPGQQLFISDGPLAGLNCEMIEYKGKKKLLVRVNLLNRSIVVALPSENLISATA